MIALIIVVMLPILLASLWGTYDYYQLKKAYELDQKRKLETYKFKAMIENLK